MLSLFNFFLDVCFLRRKPQDLAASPAVFALVLLVSLLVGTVGVSDIIQPPIKAFFAAVMDTLVMLALLRLLLMFQGHPARFLQTATALLGTGAILGLIALPLQLTVSDSLDGQQISPLISFAYLILMIWIQLVYGHILRHAIESTLTLGLGLALVYSLLSGTIVQSMFITVN